MTPMTTRCTARAGIRLAVALVSAGTLVAGLTACSPAAPIPGSTPKVEAAAGVTASPTPTAEEEISVLYSLSAEAGTLTPLGDSTSEFTLALTATDRHVVWFSDRPSRLSGTFDTALLPEDWAGFGFAEVPPTVAIVVHEAGDEADTLVAELSSPTYDVATDGFTATVRILGEESQNGTGEFDHFAAVADADLPSSFTGISIFFNDESGVVVDGCIVAPHPTC